MQRCDLLARHSELAGGLTRVFLSREYRAAAEEVLGWMREAGMEASLDAIGNVAGRYEGTRGGLPCLMLGSHLDTVRDAGRYDGMLGVITAIECVAALAKKGRRLPFAIEVLGFGDEEGVRFGATLIGSKAMAGSFEPAWLDKADDKGVTMRQALTAFGGNPDGWPDVDRRGKNVVAYVESHIEQGPVLLNEGLAVGVVTAIAGASRLRVRVTGLAGHAGTVPMGSRQDALTAASEMVLFVEKYCEGKTGLVGTVGKMTVLPGAINVIPQDVEFTIDVRSGDDALRREAVAAFQSGFEDIAKRRKVTVNAAPFYAANAAPCDPALQEAFAQAIAAHGIKVRHLPSGAGHDAMVFPAVAPTAMLFVRCGNNGISHHPDETMTAEDAEIGTLVLLHFFENYRPAP